MAEYSPSLRLAMWERQKSCALPALRTLILATRRRSKERQYRVGNSVRSTRRRYLRVYETISLGLFPPMHRRLCVRCAYDIVCLPAQASSSYVQTPSRDHTRRNHTELNALMFPRLWASTC